MSGTGFVMPPKATLEYIYDGSFSGFLCCVFESVYANEVPSAIHTAQLAPVSLFQQKLVETDPEKAQRVAKSIPCKLTKRAVELLKTCFLSYLPEKEIYMLRFLLRGYQEGASFMGQLGHEDLAPLLKAEKHLLNEAHLLKGFIRFQDSNGYLLSTITPKNFILPFVAPHFMARLSQESFLIFDKTHEAAFVYEKNQGRVIPLTGLVKNPSSADPYEGLWKLFYHSVSIEERENERCRRNNMPKRYWGNMTEMSELTKKESLLCYEKEDKFLALKTKKQCL